MLKNESLITYSRDWKKDEFITISSDSFFDIAVSKDFIYIIKVPKSGFQGALTIALGGVGGVVAGRNYEMNNREKMRAKWLDVNNQFTLDFSKYLYMQIPIQNIKNSIVRKNNKLKINFNKRVLKLKGHEEEMKKISKHIE